MRTALADWRKRVGAQENRPNPDFDPVKYRELYREVDASWFAPQHAEQREWEIMWRWRKLMNAATAKPRTSAPSP